MRRGFRVGAFDEPPLLRSHNRLVKERPGKNHVAKVDRVTPAAISIAENGILSSTGSIQSIILFDDVAMPPESGRAERRPVDSPSIEFWGTL